MSADHATHDPGWSVLDCDRAGRAGMGEWRDGARLVAGEWRDVYDVPDLSDVED